MLINTPSMHRAVTFGEYRPGADAYVLDPGEHLTDARRWWKYRWETRTVQTGNGDYVKSASRFGDATWEDVKGVVVESRTEFGVKLPSSYASVFRETFPTRRVVATYNAPFMEHLAGGWQAALRPGMHKGTWGLYDLQSAYLWAGCSGLPDAGSYRATRSFNAGVGVFLVRLRDTDRDHLPNPFKLGTVVVASLEEIRAYDLPVSEVLAGVTWTRELSATKLYDAVMAPTFGKKAARGYWGQWAQRHPVECHVASGKSWELGSPTTDLVKAHLILSRVRLRTWQACSADTAHVFVDSILTPIRDAPRCGESLGDWRLQKIYHFGVGVRAPGQYGGLEAGFDKLAGVPREVQREIKAGLTPEKWRAMLLQH